MSKNMFTSDDGRFEMEFTPIYEQSTSTKLLFVDNRCHHTGKAILDNGKVIEGKNMATFAEHAVNRW